jgi:hypothetical protein
MFILNKQTGIELEIAKRFPAFLIIVRMNEFAVRLGEVPRDKEIYLHCTTGARARWRGHTLNITGQRCTDCMQKSPAVKVR